MKLSRYFLPTLREQPADAVMVSHRLMLRAGLITQETAGIYSWLPLGLRVLQKIEALIRRQHESFGITELLMPTLQPSELWQESGRYDNYGEEMLRITDRHQRTLIYGPTNEEMITAIAKRFITSYKQLPQLLYHIQWKFRDEIRPRFGVMRGREFLMKDAYSFALTQDQATEQYETMLRCYLAIFAAMGLKAIPAQAPSGPIGGTMSHEFHILADSGESTLFYHQEHDQLTPDDDPKRHLTLYACEEELHDDTNAPSENIIKKRAIEAGHIFYFGDQYSRAMNFTITTHDGKTMHPLMGSYGIGISRLVAALIEASHDANGIIWHPTIAPFTVALINVKQGDAQCDELSDTIYQNLQSRAIDTLYDDRAMRAGVKFADMDLIGIPLRIIVGPRHAQENSVEVKWRASGKTDTCPAESLGDYLNEHLSC